jgi:L-threonylcarbamoyladenylate synthase
MIKDHQSKTIQLSANCREDLFKVLQILKNNGLVALPTETVYGLAANGLSSLAIAKVFLAKNRPANNPLILHTNDIKKAYELFDFSLCASLVEKRFLKLATFWPGPLTIIAPKNHHIPMEATGGLTHVAVRIPQNEITNEILSRLEFPLVMPSANLSTRPSPTNIQHVLTTLDGRIDAVLDDGPCELGIESTVVKIDQDLVQILRPGMINKEQLEACLEEEVVLSFASKKPLCPGQSYLHYAPKVLEVKICDNLEIDERWLSDDVIIISRCDFLLKENYLGKRVNPTIILGDGPINYAKEIYDALYQAEKYPDRILSILKPQFSADAILDRISKASRKFCLNSWLS